jgi:hypothetical protein
MNTDPLEWWTANEINFPVLNVMVWQYLGVPATSASPERLFSLAGRTFDDLRQCMKEEMLEILMWARINKEKRQRECVLFIGTEFSILYTGIKDAAASTPPQLRSGRYIRYRDNIGYPRYGESYNIGDNQYSSKNLSYCPINRFLESSHSLV